MPKGRHFLWSGHNFFLLLEGTISGSWRRMLFIHPNNMCLTSRVPLEVLFFMDLISVGHQPHVSRVPHYHDGVACLRNYCLFSMMWGFYKDWLFVSSLKRPRTLLVTLEYTADILFSLSYSLTGDLVASWSLVTVSASPLPVCAHRGPVFGLGGQPGPKRFNSRNWVNHIDVNAFTAPRWTLVLYYLSPKTAVSLF